MSEYAKILATVSLTIFLAGGCLSGADMRAAGAGGAGVSCKNGKKTEIPDYEVRVGWGGYPIADAVFFYGGPLFAAGDFAPHYPSSLEDIYRDYRGPAYMTGIISAEFDFNFKRWFALTLGLGFNGIYQNTYDPVTDRKTGQNSGVSVTFLPEARFNWVNRRLVRMYSAVGLGLSVGSLYERDYGRSDTMIYPVFQITPVGISVGRGVYGFAELGVGTQYIGGAAGVGIRF